MIEQALVYAAIALAAYFVRGITGAASAIVFNAIFLVLLALDLVAGLTVIDGIYWVALANALASVLMAGALARSWRPERFVLLLMAGSLPMNVVFTLLLPSIDTGGLMAAMAVVIMLTGIFLATRGARAPLSERTLNRLALPIGATAGVLGGLFGMAGPAVFLLLSSAGGDPTQFRARVTLINTSSSLLRLGVLATQGVYGADRLGAFALSAPAVLIGIAAGMYAHRFVRPGPFRVALGVLVSLAGALALVQTLAEGG